MIFPTTERSDSNLVLQLLDGPPSSSTWSLNAMGCLSCPIHRPRTYFFPSAMVDEFYRQPHSAIHPFQVLPGSKQHHLAVL